MAGSSTVAQLALVGAGGEPVDLWRTISSHGVADLPPNRIDDEQRTLEVTVAVARGKPRTAVISQGTPGYARVELGGGKADGVLDTVRHMLGLDADLSPFYELVADDPDLDWVAKGAGRMLRSPTVFEEVVKTICTTNCAWSGTVRMVSALVEHLGAPSGRRLAGSVWPRVPDPRGDGRSRRRLLPRRRPRRLPGGVPAPARDLGRRRRARPGVVRRRFPTRSLPPSCSSSPASGRMRRRTS